jgi:hypothetical protein
MSVGVAARNATATAKTKHINAFSLAAELLSHFKYAIFEL